MTFQNIYLEQFEEYPAGFFCYLLKEKML